MAYVDIEYKQFSFEENPILITWIQLYMIKLLKEEKIKTDWKDKIINEWDLNSKIDIYKYLFDEDLLDTEEKEQWARMFMQKAIEKAESQNLKEFGDYIGIEINPIVDYERIKGIFKKVNNMLNGKSPE